MFVILATQQESTHYLDEVHLTFVDLKYRFHDDGGIRQG
jgi:hypothetical protein